MEEDFWVPSGTSCLWNLTGKLNFESQIVHQKLQVAGVIFVCFCFVWGPHHVFKLCELVVNI